MTDCDVAEFTVAWTQTGQIKVIATDAADAERKVLAMTPLAIGAPGVSLSFPMEITATKEYSDGGVGREAPAR